LPPLRQVPRDLREATQSTVLVAHRGDDDTGPEAGAVLAQPPAFFLVFPRGRRDYQHARRLAGFHFLRRVEAREVLTNDLLRRVALDPLGPGVPGEDVALGIEHEDGKV